MIFLGKLNHLELWGADIGNAYLEAFTDEKLYIVAGPEFQELEGYILIILKALCGLKSSGKRWAEVIHGILRDMKVLPSKADPCDMIYIKTQVFRLLRYYSPEHRNIARSDWVTQNITHNMTSSIIQPYGLHSLQLCFIHEKGNFNYALHKPHDQKELQGISHHYILYSNHLFIYFI